MLKIKIKKNILKILNNKGKILHKNFINLPSSFKNFKWIKEKISDRIILNLNIRITDNKIINLIIYQNNMIYSDTQTVPI
jgi:hypothetical protein